MSASERAAASNSAILAAANAAAAVLIPRIGEVNYSLPCTRGPNQTIKSLAQTSYTVASRPMVFKSANTIDHVTTKGLPNDHHI